MFKICIIHQNAQNGPLLKTSPPEFCPSPSPPPVPRSSNFAVRPLFFTTFYIKWDEWMNEWNCPRLGSVLLPFCYRHPKSFVNRRFSFLPHNSIALHLFIYYCMFNSHQLKKKKKRKKKKSVWNPWENLIFQFLTFLNRKNIFSFNFKALTNLLMLLLFLLLLLIWIQPNPNHLDLDLDFDSRNAFGIIGNSVSVSKNFYYW